MSESKNIGTTENWVSLAIKVVHSNGSASVVATVNNQPVDGILHYDLEQMLPPDMAIAQAYINLSGCMPDTVDCQHFHEKGDEVEEADENTDL